MNKQEQFYKYFKKLSFIILIFIILFLFLQHKEYQSYQINTNRKINAILNEVIKQYPDVTKNELIEILNSNKSEENFVKEYGINIKKESIVLKNDVEFVRNQIINFGFFLIILGILIFSFLSYNRKKDQKIKDLISLVERINKRNYQLDFNDIMEDELSILKNEIYKTTIMLKEQAENSMKDKIDLKNSLSDISHQLKTPLTSILIMLDNLTLNPSMEVHLKNEFIHDIKREIMNIRFLTEAILKLSKLESKTVEMKQEPVLVGDLIQKAILNLKALCDLKNVSLKTDIQIEQTIICDFEWQVEALTNILKNCIEHSHDGGIVDIKSTSNKFYITITITDYGDPIDKEDLPYIFKRFYKGKNASKDSIGIGLALSKSIIESSGGTIKVISNNQKTEFKIQYFFNN